MVVAYGVGPLLNAGTLARTALGDDAGFMCLGCGPLAAACTARMWAQHTAQAGKCSVSVLMLQVPVRPTLFSQDDAAAMTLW
jgi:hypothetical protein